MTPERKAFEAYIATYHPALQWQLDGSTHDPRWAMAKSEEDTLWRVWQRAYLLGQLSLNVKQPTLMVAMTDPMTSKADRT